MSAVLYSGGLTLETIFGLPLRQGVWAIGLIATLYTVWGGLKAVAWADLFQGLALIAGGMLTFVLGLKACGGWDVFTTMNAAKLHMILPAGDADLPWTGVVSGMFVVIIYYCGLNQFIVQRNLAAKTLRDGQLGVIFAGALWLLVPFAIVMPGIMAAQLYGESLGSADRAYPTLIRELVPDGVRGFMFAAISGAVISSLASMLNSASAIFTMDIYKRILRPAAEERTLVWAGRSATVVAAVSGCAVAPMLSNPDFGGVFQFIQQFQGYIRPGVVGAFVMAFCLPRAPASAGVASLVAGPIFYGALQFTSRTADRSWGHTLHFLLQVFVAFALVCALMAVITVMRPLPAPRVLPVREDVAMRTDTIVKIAGAIVLAGVALLVFWFR
jgi:SSS family solute:Na+ symporter